MFAINGCNEGNKGKFEKTYCLMLLSTKDIYADYGFTNR